MLFVLYYVKDEIINFFKFGSDHFLFYSTNMKYSKSVFNFVEYDSIV